MLAKHSILARLLVVVMVGCAFLAAPRPAAGSAPDTEPYVKYYVVTARYQGQSENLTEIARRFLGSGERSAEIYQLNTGRVQPDGRRLTDPAALRAGWYLVLPWDAAGQGVEYGQLPAARRPSARPTPSGSPGPRPDSSPTPDVTATPSGSPTRSAPGVKCTARSASSGRSEWAQLRMAADSAWTLTRGNGVKVAVVDTGVDAGLQQLSGRVAVGADVTVGNGRGDEDCLGSGTAMAGIIAADDSVDGRPVGLAPDATIVPVRMVRSSGDARPADAATAIEVAVSTGAQVVALGSRVDLADPAVAAALSTALEHDVVVVAGAPVKPTTLPSPRGGSGGGALVLTGGVGAGGQLAEKYLDGSVEVVAPGIEVATLGVGGGKVVGNTGTELAVAFVAGAAALVRAVEPGLTATQVEERIRGTADPVGGQVAEGDARYGTGMINPAAAVAPSVEGPAPAAAQAGRGGGALVAVLLGFAVLFGAGGFLVYRLRRRRFTG
ncbi:S8 family serine peptidase [Micromonospora sp. WMMC241]|uniref:S8 family serine peptidase n=1 Tax=Micromonospora sp. WMMC241 TaxID=3015159 RepID=UPI0022B6C8B2|nr:S8 family serine peptidase [Micromonospora sp. WMMC241]MCZ7436861.1 S8 family serine peptidase [Micromonospora sp. WMMC241]